jgi:hypothetical protein
MAFFVSRSEVVGATQELEWSGRFLEGFSLGSLVRTYSISYNRTLVHSFYVILFIFIKFFYCAWTLFYLLPLLGKLFLEE